MEARVDPLRAAFVIITLRSTNWPLLVHPDDIASPSAHILEEVTIMELIRTRRLTTDKTIYSAKTDVKLSRFEVLEDRKL